MLMTYEDILREVAEIRRILGNTPEPVFFEGAGKDLLAGRVLEALACYGKLESVCYTSHQLISNLEERINISIKEREEADRRWKEKYSTDFMETIKEGPGDAE
ncbi:MAG: hypothetical protein UHU21_07470 [Lachnospiraceae bacterium]|nr:hypothetical protein [Lachnospiraceae bacterium]